MGGCLVLIQTLPIGEDSRIRIGSISSNKEERRIPMPNSRLNSIHMRSSSSPNTMPKVSSTNHNNSFTNSSKHHRATISSTLLSSNMVNHSNNMGNNSNTVGSTNRTINTEAVVVVIRIIRVVVMDRVNMTSLITINSSNHSINHHQHRPMMIGTIP